MVCSLFDMFTICVYLCFFFFKQKTAYEMRISDWSSDVCSSDLFLKRQVVVLFPGVLELLVAQHVERPADPPARAARLDHVVDEAARGEIGRASCRERVCQYV